MRNFLFIILFLIIAIKGWGAPVLQDLNYILNAPPKTEDEKSLYQYLNTLYGRWNTIQITIQEPNGNITANYGNIIVYKNGSTFSLAVETTSPSGKTWKGIALGAV